MTVELDEQLQASNLSERNERTRVADDRPARYGRSIAASSASHSASSQLK